jgi:MFS family permease
VQRNDRLAFLGPVTAAASAATLSTVPIFVVSSLATIIQRDISFTPSDLGIVVAVYYVSAALGSLPNGWIVSRFGPAMPTRIGVGTAGACLLILTRASSWEFVAVCLAVSGLINPLVHLAANQRIADEVPPELQGLALGVKQSSVPLAVLIGGLTVPVLAVGMGWRATFAVLGTAVLLFAALARPRSRSASPSAPPARTEHVPIDVMVLAVSVVFATASATALATFLGVYLVSEGLSPSTAGVMSAAGAASAVCARLLLGWLADRDPRIGLPTIGSALLVAAVCCAGFAIDLPPAVLLLVTVLTFGLGWGWGGVVNLDVIRRYPLAAARATSLTQMGVYVGAVLGPAVFGILVSGSGYPAAWLGVSLGFLAASGLLLVDSHRRVASRRHSRLHPPAGA